ncbi:MAG: acyl-CoA dehydrogenase [Dehalococcoidia bacterium]|nr:acyl-CoA dehydrogenase [Dehalococcoidia bacterium]MCB9485905.1 acyl-CoA dehydrogenase [Thermoflexaceae bacterium]
MPETVPPDLLDLRSRIQSFLAALPDVGNDDVPADLAEEVRARSREAALFTLLQPRSLGGDEAGPLARVVAWEALAAANSPYAHFVFGPRPGIVARAEGPLRDRLLPAVLAGEKRGSFAFTEPSGPDAPPRPTWARRDGDDLLVTGRKSYVSGGATADFYGVLVNVDPEGDRPAGPAMLVIEAGTPGVTMDRRFSSLDGGHHVSLVFEEARVPAANVIGRVGDGMRGALGNITDERLELSATSCGIAMWTTEFVTAHVTATHPSGNRLGDREGVRLRYSDLRIETYAARAMLYRTARMVESGADAMNEIMATKVFTCEAVNRIVDTAVQLVGGNALISGHPLEKLYRRVRSLRLAGGATDVLRLNIARGRIEFESGTL